MALAAPAQATAAITAPISDIITRLISNPLATSGYLHTFAHAPDTGCGFAEVPAVADSVDGVFTGRKPFPASVRVGPPTRRHSVRFTHARRSFQGAAYRFRSC